MVVYKSCGFLGFFPQEATAEDFAKSNYQPDKFTTDCGFLGFGATPAEFKDIPADLRACTGASNGTYKVTSPGTCELQSCAGGAVRAGDKCVKPFTPCTPDNVSPNAHYTYAGTGDCVATSCAVGYVLRPEYTAGGLGRATCPPGFSPITTSQGCKAAAGALKVKPHTPFESKEPFLLEGCVVHGGSGGPGAAFNSGGGAGTPTSDPFLLCQRSSDNACIKQGANCLPSHPNYTYNAAGLCLGTCKNKDCAPGDKCCPGSHTCVPEGSKCPIENNMQKEAKGLAHSIAAAAASVEQLSSVVSGGVNGFHSK